MPLQQGQGQHPLLLPSRHAAGYGFDGKVCEICPIGELQGPNVVCDICDDIWAAFAEKVVTHFCSVSQPAAHNKTC
jgi:hypothetical protein